MVLPHREIAPRVPWAVSAGLFPVWENSLVLLSIETIWHAVQLLIRNQSLLSVGY